ncbi:MAG: PIG-L family deacetylase [Anaerolineaceae bacterium]|nr:PIG-L family deacetylase [Anaerolineaceae bacterium]
MHWIFLSPHFDDAVFSCGGLIYEQVQQGDQLEVWTICAGDLPEGQLSPFAEELHARWTTGRETISSRAAEDQLACSIVGAGIRRFAIPDCIYRNNADGTPLVSKNDDLFMPLASNQIELAEALANDLRSAIQPDTTLVSPLSIGGHIDHRLTRYAAEKTSHPIWYYADFPYVLRQTPNFEGMSVVMEQKISPAGLSAWQNSVAAYKSQISTFWPDEAGMRSVLHQFCIEGGGSVLWQATNLPDSISGGL